MSLASPIAPPTRLSNTQWIDPNALMRVKNLQWRAKTIVDGFHNGLHRSPHHGFSVEFSEYRPYTPGEDPRGIDWKLFARTDRYYLKKFEDETNRRCQLIVDQSRSMAFGSLAYTKSDYARTLAATLAYYFTMQRDAVGMVTFEEQVTGRIPARFRPGQLKRLLGLLEAPTSGSHTDLQKPLAQLAEMVHHRSLMLILSDFLVPLDSFRSALTFLRARRHEVVLLRLTDPAERTLPWTQPTLVRDLETGREIYVDPQAAKSQYEKRFAEHGSQLASLAGSLGIDWIDLTTDQPLEMALFEMLSHQQRRGSVAHHPTSRNPSPLSASRVGS